jgi:nudix motif 8
LVENFTAPSLAKALRDREETLQLCALAAQKGDLPELQRILFPFSKENVEKKRKKLRQKLDLSKGFTKTGLSVIQRLLHRQPREVKHSSRRRASVMIPLCDVNGVASVLFERRSAHMRRHKHEVCFPGGMADIDDPNIIHTSVREMEEELGISSNIPDVLGILRCDWSELLNLTGVAVTPVVGYIGRFEDLKLMINHDEVSGVLASLARLLSCLEPSSSS